MNRATIYDLIDTERARQEELYGGEHGWGSGSCASPGLEATLKVAVLLEEVGEVARAVLDFGESLFWDGEPKELRGELVQVAAVAVAWLESMTDPPAEPPPVMEGQEALL